MLSYPSILLSKAVDQFASLPGIGRKTALRLVLHLLRQSDSDVEAFTAALNSLKKDVFYCRICHTISDQEICPICQSTKRDRHTVCVVENVTTLDISGVDKQYHGLYHVLGGVISPMDGVGPSDLEIDSLVARIEPEEIREVISNNEEIKVEENKKLTKKYTDFIVNYTKNNEKVIAFPEEDTVFFDGKNIRVIGELAYYTFENGKKQKIEI